MASSRKHKFRRKHTSHGRMGLGSRAFEVLKDRQGMTTLIELEDGETITAYGLWSAGTDLGDPWENVYVDVLPWIDGERQRVDNAVDLINTSEILRLVDPEDGRAIYTRAEPRQG